MASERAWFKVTLLGCDDKTDMLVDLTNAEAQVVHRLAELSTKASAYRCQPRLTIDFAVAHSTSTEE